MASSHHHPSAMTDRKWTPPSQFGNYALEREVDGGGMGTVYRGMTITDRKPVAIKFLIESSQYKRFQREIDAGKRIHHPNFVRYHDTGEIDGHFFIVMDFIDGLPLKKYMEQYNLNPDRRLELFFKIVSAMAFAHQSGIIHRDLKPANIMINRQAEPIILDFGLAKYLQVPDDDITALTMEGQIIGTPGYMSPEQARGEIENQDERTDIFALGIILYEMLTARNPFEGSNFLEVCYNIAHRAPANIEQVLPGIPHQLAYICNKALARDKDQRYQNAKEFAEDIKAYIAWRKKAHEYPTVADDSLRVEDIMPCAQPNNSTESKTPSTDKNVATSRKTPSTDRKIPKMETVKPPENEQKLPPNYDTNTTENQLSSTPNPRNSSQRISLNYKNELIPNDVSKSKRPISQRIPIVHEESNVDRIRKTTCPFCGAFNPPNQEFCQNCRQPFTTTAPKINSAFLPAQAGNIANEGNPSAIPINPQNNPQIPVVPVNAAPPILLRKPKPPAIKPALKFPTLSDGSLKNSTSNLNQDTIQFIVWLACGAILMPIAMIPSSPNVAIWGYLWDIASGAFAALLVTHFPKGLIGGLLFATTSLLAWTGKWVSQALPSHFLTEKIGFIILALVLAFLLGINFGLVCKKMTATRRLKFSAKIQS